jgi:hypothetical protein
MGRYLFAMISPMEMPILLPEESLFFDYTCDHCGSPVCERMQIMNLSLDYIEELYCLSCLSKQQGLSEAEMAETAKDYVQGRECFKTPWDNFAPQAQQCPLLKYQLCSCQDQMH